MLLMLLRLRPLLRRRFAALLRAIDVDTLPLAAAIAPVFAEMPLFCFALLFTPLRY